MLKTAYVRAEKTFDQFIKLALVSLIFKYCTLIILICDTVNQLTLPPKKTTFNDVSLLLELMHALI